MLIRKSLSSQCGRQIAGYSHFQNGECKLFDEMTDEELWYQMRLNELPPDAMVAEAAQVDPALRNQVKVCPVRVHSAAREGRRTD